MIDAQGNGLVFLLCVPRSGSSLSTVMLQNHSRIFATQEMWFLMNLVDLNKADSRAYGGSSIIRQFYNAMVSEDVFEKACRSFALEIYNGFLEGSGADFIVDKSPRYYYMLEWLDRLFPQSKRIHLQRNPLAIAASFKKVNRHTGEGFDLTHSLQSPKLNMKSVDLTLGMLRLNEYFAEPHSNAYELQYERLVSNPQEELEKLCAFLGIRYEQGMEQYGQFLDSAKSDMFYSMGVGDPFLSSHQKAHQGSVNNWKNILEPHEVELYCRVMGADLFHRMGYSEQLAEAEQWTGVHYDASPDQEVIDRITHQLTAATGCQWQPQYRMQPADSVVHDPLGNLNDQVVEEPEKIDPTLAALATIRQLQAALRAADHRLERGYSERERLKVQLASAQSKIQRIKSWVPFGHQISAWASQRKILRGGKS
ncbi:MULTISPECIES: sulfotransferase [unclassified Paenibacillus]|uniref:sulfotransferase family protein n=1 Tax=unclassified Paenibacillus TaxID=185978 RepID=UPI000CFB9AC6|nr:MULTISPECIES: sulfotransferase [unclassified Paenibacillus]MBD8840344.1 sulfotransferase [Paenibacillus sp. CFBP 13594]PRA08968.1 protein tyrosine phosphatase [Paenibacillus sp. MYb63]PRA48902.1 protein tyrosine phosphatase [Paenibacillus sp. MYb67]QZN73194.1 sulfotransferase [Paenibacillus sp. DR312]